MILWSRIARWRMAGGSEWLCVILITIHLCCKLFALFCSEVRTSRYHGPTETPKIEIKQSKRPNKSKNQIPLPSHSSHPTPKWNQNNQNTGIIPVNIERCRPDLSVSLCDSVSVRFGVCQEVPTETGRGGCKSAYAMCLKPLVKTPCGC